MVMAPLAALVYFVLFCVARASESRDCVNNVGTVLFFRSDLGSDCWSNRQLNLLRSRRLLQHALPPADTVDYTSDDTVHLLMRYLRQAFSEVRSPRAATRDKQLMAEALADAVGGYLKHDALPAVRLAYYAGTVSYETAQNLTDYYGHIKRWLDTDGGSWRAPDPELLESLPLRVEPAPEPRAAPQQEAAVCRLLSFTKSWDSDLELPMPTINWEYEPHLMSVPFERSELVPVEAPEAAYVLYHYYTTADNCLTARQTWSERDDFRERFRRWSAASVLPHLNDDKLYVAFGSVLRLVNGSAGEGRSLFTHVSEFPVKITDYHHFEPETWSLITKIPILAGALAIIWAIPIICFIYVKTNGNCKKSKKKRNNGNGGGNGGNGGGGEATALLALSPKRRQQYKSSNPHGSSGQTYPCEVLYTGHRKPSNINDNHNHNNEKSSYDDSSKTSTNYKTKTSELMLKVSRANSVHSVSVGRPQDKRRVPNSLSTKTSFARCSSMKVDRTAKPGGCGGGVSTTSYAVNMKEIEAAQLSEVLNYFSTACTNSDDLVSGDHFIEMPSSLSTLSPNQQSSRAERPASQTLISNVEPAAGAHRSSNTELSTSSAIHAGHAASHSAGHAAHHADSDTHEGSSARREDRPSRIPQKRHTMIPKRIVPDGR